MLQKYLHIEKPEELSDEVWCLKLKLLERLRQDEARQT